MPTAAAERPTDRAPHRPVPWHLYALALAFPAATALLLRQVGSPDSFLLVGLLPVTVVAMRGGLLPGLAATIAGVLGRLWLTSEGHPAGDYPDPLELGVFVFVGVMISGANEALLHARHRAERRAGEKARLHREALDAAEALRRGEERFRTLIERAPVGITVARDGRFLYANAACLALTGYASADELIGRPLSDVVAPEDWPMIAERMRRREAGEAVPSSYDFTGMRRDGSRRRWHLETTFMTLADGPGIVAFVTDVTEERGAEEALRRREQEFAALVERSPDMVVRFGRDRRHSYVNPAVEAVTGLKREEIVGRTQDELGVAPELLRLWDEELGSVFETGRGTRFEMPYDVEGRRTWHQVRLVPEVGEDGAVESVFAVARDVTEQREATRALRESERRFRGVVESNMIGIGFWSAGGMVTDANDALLDMIGYTREEFARGGISWQDLTPPEYYASDEKAYAQTQALGHCTPYEKEYRRRDGTRVPVLIGGCRFEGERDRGAFFVVDITDRRRAEEALRASELRAKRLIESNIIGVIVADSSGRVHEANDAWLATLGFTREDVAAGRVNSRELTPPEYLEADARALAELALTGSHQPYEKEYVRKDGGRVPALVGTASLGGPDDLAVGFLLDLTERHRSREQAAAAQRMEAVGRLAGGVAHEVNNALTAILGSSDFVLRGFDPHDPRRTDVEEIRRAADRATAITQQLLAFGRRQVLQLHVLDLNAVVRDLRNMLRRALAEDRELALELAPEPAHIRADPGKLEQVLVNLVLNARDATGPGGRVTVRTRFARLPDPAHPAGPADLPPGEYVVLAVSDTGHGMDAATRARIFEPFFTTKPPGRGTGLGLATVYGIVQQSEGAIGVESSPGQGTTFEIYLPRSPAGTTAESPAAPAPAPARSTGGETVLVVEDEDMVRSYACRLLRSGGYAAVEARNGVEALRRIEEEPEAFDLVLTDVVMPGLGGRELGARIAALRPGLPVLYMSGYTDDDVLRRGMAPGAPILQKPFAPDALTTMVRELLDRARRLTSG